MSQVKSQRLLFSLLFLFITFQEISNRQTIDLMAQVSEKSSLSDPSEDSKIEKIQSSSQIRDQSPKNESGRTDNLSEDNSNPYVSNNKMINQKTLRDNISIKEISMNDKSGNSSDTVERSQTSNKQAQSHITPDNESHTSLDSEDEHLDSTDQSNNKSEEVEYVYMDKEDEEKLLLTDEERSNLEEKIKSMGKDQIDSAIKSLISKKTLNTKQFSNSSVFNQLETGLVITRYFYKKNYSTELLNLVSFLKCNLTFGFEEKEYEAVTISTKNKHKKVLKKVREPIVSIERDEPIDPQFQYRFSYNAVSQFSDSYAAYCRQVDNVLEPLKNMLYEFKNSDQNDPEKFGLESFLGVKIEKLIRENEKNFIDFGENAFTTSDDMLNIIKNIDCNLKDMMAFYQLLPRFFLLYKRIQSDLESKEDPVVLYYKDKLVDIHSKWLKTNNELFGYIGSFNVWLILNMGLFKMPGSFPSDDFFKISMIEMMAKSMIELTLEKDRYKTAIKNILIRYKNIYDEIEDFFEGLEEYLYIKVPFDFPKLEAKSFDKVFGMTWMVLGGLIMLWFKD